MNFYGAGDGRTVKVRLYLKNFAIVLKMNENSSIYDGQESEKQPLLATEPTTYNGEAGGRN